MNIRVAENAVFRCSSDKIPSMNDSDIIIESPCVRQCCLDTQDICLGCGRHIDEITGWQAACREERLAILERALQRRGQAI
jgi:predicted Fe-S protein YdhL (DUF1289 family)